MKLSQLRHAVDVHIARLSYRTENKRVIRKLLHRENSPAIAIANSVFIKEYFQIVLINHCVLSRVSCNAVQ